jgi:aarF domain-containing kinase
MTSFFARQIPSSFRTSLTDFFTDRIILETDFLNEVSNAEHMREVILHEPRLRDVVHIPKTYPALCTKRVMVAEWIRGTSISQSEVLTGPWKDNEAIGTPYTAKCSSKGAKAQMVYGLGLQEERIMSVMLDLFCAQTFMFGEVHCDPVNNYRSISNN